MMNSGGLPIAAVAQVMRRSFPWGGNVQQPAHPLPSPPPARKTTMPTLTTTSATTRGTRHNITLTCPASFVTLTASPPSKLPPANRQAAERAVAQAVSIAKARAAADIAQVAQDVQDKANAKAAKARADAARAADAKIKADRAEAERVKADVAKADAAYAILRRQSQGHAK